MSTPAAATATNSTPAPQYGGQAVIEGVMMRGVRFFAVAARRADGRIALTCEPVPKVLRPAWQKFPFLRGAFALVDAMALGTKALFWAARIAEEDTRQPQEQAHERASAELVGPALGTAAPAPESSASPKSSRVTDVAIGGAMVTGLLFALCLIVVFPNLAIEAAKRLGWNARWQLGLVDGLTRITIFFGYIKLISRMGHVRRVFQYHGAEHKAINALEAGVNPPTVAAARNASRLHPRCGTSFVFIVLLLSTLAFAPFYGLPPLLRVPIHFLMALPVAGVAFELLRAAGKYRANPVMAALSRPGMWTQLLTTREPDDAQLEIALASLQAVMDAEAGDGGGAAAATTEARQASAVA